MPKSANKKQRAAIEPVIKYSDERTALLTQCRVGPLSPVICPVLNYMSAAVEMSWSGARGDGGPAAPSRPHGAPRGGLTDGDGSDSSEWRQRAELGPTRTSACTYKLTGCYLYTLGKDRPCKRSGAPTRLRRIWRQTAMHMVSTRHVSATRLLRPHAATLDSRTEHLTTQIV